MGLRPGESDCTLCVKRPLDQGGSGACPMRGALFYIHRERRDCPKFQEGDYQTKAERKLKQAEALF